MGNTQGTSNSASVLPSGQQQQQRGGHPNQQQQRGHPQGGGGGGVGHVQQQQQQHGMGAYDTGPYGQVKAGGGGGGGGYGQQQSPYGGGGGGVRDPYSMSSSGMDTASTMSDASSQQQQQQQQQPSSEDKSSTSSLPLDMAILSAADDDTVPTVFRWEHGGRQVYITGTFNGWSRQIPMHRSGNDFTYIHNLKRGKHAFKFIVDDEWRFAPDQPTVADIEGRINNFIDVTDFKAYTGDRDFEKEKAAAEYGEEKNEDHHHHHHHHDKTPGEDAKSKQVDSDAGGGAVPGATTGTSATKPDRDGEVFSHNMPDLDEYTKEPPPLPPHLRHIILNKPPQLQDTAALPVPQHVALNHLYCTAIKDNMMVLGITQRYKTKFVTTVYYSPCKN